MTGGETERLAALLKLVAKWRAQAERCFHSTPQAFRRGGFKASDQEFVRQETLDQCANELEAALGGAEGSGGGIRRAEDKDQALARMDTPGSSTDSRTAPTEGS